MAPTRVLVLIDQFYSADGGTEQQLVSLLDRLDGGRFAVDLVVMRRLSDFVDSPRLPASTRCLELRSLAAPATWRGLAGLARRLRAGRHDVLHTLFPESVTMGPFLAAASGAAHVTSRRDLGFWYTPLKLFWLRRGRRFTSLYLANSAAVRDSVCAREHAPPGRVRIIPNAIEWAPISSVSPVDARARLGLPAAGTVFVLPANLRPVKGVDQALRALGALARDGADVHLVSIGENSLLGDAYRALCDELGIADRVRFLGHLPRAQTLAWAAGADAVLNTSHSEGLSNAVLEAMALARPVVATAVGGNRELVRHGETGLLAAPGDVDDLARQMLAIHRDRAGARAMGARAGGEVAERHDPGQVARAYEDAYREAAAQRRQR